MSVNMELAVDEAVLVEAAEVHARRTKRRQEVESLGAFRPNGHRSSGIDEDARLIDSLMRGRTDKSQGAFVFRNTPYKQSLIRRGFLKAEAVR